MRENEKMVKFRSFYNDPENRNIMEIVQTPTGAVTIYEPTTEDIRTIMSLDDAIAAMNQEVNSDEGNTITLHEASILKVLIPRLTDLDMEDLTDDEIDEIIGNLNAEGSLLMASLERVISQIYTLMIINFSNQQMLKKLIDISDDLTDQTLGMYITQAAKTDEGRRQIHELNQQAKKVAKMQKQEEQEMSEKDEDDSDEGVSFNDAPSLDPDVDSKEAKTVIKGHFSGLDE